MKNQKIHINKSIPVLPPINSPTAVNEKTLDKVLILTKNDLDRLNHHLNRQEREQEAVEEELQRKKELHEKSLALTRNWNNTIEGSRRFKLEQKKIREEKLEEKRRAVDLEHAQFMAQERKKALEQAKLLQYHETDRVKTFHSALKYTEVLKEREAQIEMRKLIEKMKKEEEEDFLIQVNKIGDDKEKKEAELKQKKTAERLDLADFHKKQIQTHTERKLKEKEQIAKEAEILAQLMEQYDNEREQQEAERLKKVKELKETYDKALENKKKIHEAEKLMDEEENEELRIYATAKKKMAVLKRKKEDEIEKDKQDKREQMMAYLGSLFKQQVADEDFRIAKAVQKAETKLAQEEYFKEMKNRRERAEINQYRLDTIKRKQSDKLEQKKVEEEEMKKKVEADYLCHMYELEKNKQQKQKQNTISKENFKNSKERKDEEKRIRQTDKEYVKKEMELLALEDDQFESYARNVIDYMEKHGRNTYPMKKMVNETLNKGQDFENMSPAALIKKLQNDVPTNKNLGFTS